MKKYCKYCGHKLESVESRFYNEETGEKETVVRCVNKNCDLSIFYSLRYKNNYNFIDYEIKD